jgi:Tol biopolymer transport system component
MTAFDRFDPFEQRIVDAIDEIAAPRRPDYLDDVFRQTARSSQRPRWTFPERWLPMDVAVRSAPRARLPIRPLALVLLLALLLAAAIGIAVVGSMNAVPSPFGVADNGLIGYTADGDLWARDARTDERTRLLSTPLDEIGPWYSPDGRRFLFIRSTGAASYLWTADADGSNERQLVPDAMVGESNNAIWAPDSGTVAVVNEIRGLPVLSLLDASTGQSRTIDLGDLRPTSGLAFRPPDGRELLVRVSRPDRTIDLALVDLATGDVRPLGIPSPLLFGPTWDNSGPTWSPDGTRIAYNRVEVDPATSIQHFRVHVMNADGAGDVALPGPADPGTMEAWPAWSPDGTQLLVHRWTWKENGGGQGWVALMPADGSAGARDIGPRIPGGEDTGVAKTWSPDGTRILTAYANTRQVFEIDPVTGIETELPWTSELPDWQRVKRWP